MSCRYWAKNSTSSSSSAVWVALKASRHRLRARVLSLKVCSARSSSPELKKNSEMYAVISTTTSRDINRAMPPGRSAFRARLMAPP